MIQLYQLRVYESVRWLATMQLYQLLVYKSESLPWLCNDFHPLV